MVSRKNLIIFGILVLAAFLRFFRIEENFIFSPEVGHNFLAIKNTILSGQVPLLGPPTSHPWLYFGPLYYWLMIPLLWLANFNPFVGAYFGALVGVMVVLINYLVIQKIFGSRVAIFSSFLIAISPLWLQFTREARFFSLVLPLVYLFVWSLYKKKYFLLGLSLGLMFNFHYTPIIFIPMLLSLFLIKFNSRNLRHSILAIVLRCFVGIIIPSVPLLIYDSLHKFQMITNLILWIPYRLAGFIGIYPKNTVSSEVVQGTLANFYKFINLSFLPDGNLLSLIILCILVIYLIKMVKEPILLLWLSWGLIALFVHGNPPLHYFLPLFPLPIIIFSLFLSDLWRKKIGKVMVTGILSILVVVNFSFFFSDKWFFLPQDRIWPGTDYVPYKLQQKIVKTIVNDASGRPYNLARVGPYDYFEGNFSQNYQYLSWWMGNEARTTETRLRYTIYEDNLPKTGEKIFEQAKIAVFKEEK